MTKHNIKISEGMLDDGVVVGNAYDKYGSENPIVRRIMAGFSDALSSLVSQATPRSIHEVGCGEGYWVCHWNKQGLAARGSDFSEKVIALSRENAKRMNLPEDIFFIRSIYDLEQGQDSADLVICCEVLEHVENPCSALSALQKVASNYVILSVPREPIWRLLNMVRGKYWRQLGNTPGHLNHWSSRSFIHLASQYFDIVEVKKPLPWTMLLCRVRR